MEGADLRLELSDRGTLELTVPGEGVAQRLDLTIQQAQELKLFLLTHELDLEQYLLQAEGGGVFVDAKAVGLPV